MMNVNFIQSCIVSSMYARNQVYVLINPIPFGLFFVLILSGGGGQICPPLEFMYKIDQISFLGLVFCRIPSSDPLS